MSKKIIRLTESELIQLVRNVVSEQVQDKESPLLKCIKQQIPNFDINQCPSCKEVIGGNLFKLLGCWDELKPIAKDKFSAIKNCYKNQQILQR